MFSVVRSATSARAGLMSRKAVMSSVTAIRTKVSLPDLPYDYNALEPAICSEIMTLHHSKHHNTYVTNYNLQEEQLDEAIHKGDTSKIIALQGALKFNGGGHINHDIFWTNLAPTNQGGGDFPSGKLYDDLIAKWGSVEAFQKDMAAKTAAVQGSGWGWLGYDKVNKSLKIQTCANQDPLEATTGLIPLLGIDVWEHAYYLQYKNVRPDYLNEIWKIVNWQNVAERYNKAQ